MEQAEAILAGRSSLKMSQEHLSTAAGISARTVVRAESGLRVSGESLRNICAVLGLDATRIAQVHGLPSGDKDAAQPPVPEAVGSPLGEEVASPGGSAPTMAWPSLKDLPRRLLGLRKTPLVILFIILSAVGSTLAFAPVLSRVADIDDVRRWTLEIQPSRVVADHLNAIASGRQGLRPPALFYFHCMHGKSGVQLYLAGVAGTDCGLTRHDILVETSVLAGGTRQTVIGPVGREFGRDLARRLSGDPRVLWKVAFASGRQAQGLAWFDPRAVPAQDMPRPPDSPSTWVYVAMTGNGAGR